MNNQKSEMQQYLEGQTFFGSFKIIINYIINDIQKKPRSFKIGIFTIFLVIGFISAIQSVFQLSPVIFLQIAENQTGDPDIILLPDPNAISSNIGEELSLKLLNHTEIEQACDKVQEIQGCSPRWMITGDLMHPDTYTENEEEVSKDQFLNKYKSYIIGYDSVRERSVGLGRRNDVGPLSGNDVYVSGSTVRGLELKKNEQILLNMDLVGDFLLAPQFLNLGDDSEDFTLEEEFTKGLVTLMEDQLGIPEFDISAQEIQDAAQLILDTSNTFGGSGEDLFPIVEGLAIGFGFEPGNNLDFIKDQNITEFAQQLKDAADDLEDPNFNIQTVAEVLAPILIDALNFTATFNIKEAIDSPEGKWADILGHVIMIDIDNLVGSVFGAVKEQLRTGIYEADTDANPILGVVAALFPEETLNETVDNFQEDFNIREYSVLTNIVLNDRMDIYLEQDTIDQKFKDISNVFYETIGKDHSSIATTPLATSVGGLLIIKLFLDNIIICAVFLLAMLSVLLIYSLMLSDVEEKTYEFGMLRALGLKKISLINLLMTEGLFFAIPGLSLGLLFAYLINATVGYLIFSSASIVTTYALHYTAILLAIGLGLFIPIFSNYFPIKRALNKTLRDSLDMYHRSANEVAINVIKLEKMGISFPQFICALLLIVMGVVSYYFAPAAFINQDIAMFLFIINLVLILLILGVTLIANLAQGQFEKLLIKLFLCFNPRDKRFEHLIKKNLEGHQTRNQKTSLMYTISIAFLIFVGTAFNLQTVTISDMLASFIACDIKVQVPLDPKYSLDEFGLREYMESYKKKHPDHIKGYTFVSVEMSAVPQFARTELSTLAQFPSFDMNIYGIEENYLESVILDFYIPTQFDSDVAYKDLSNGQKNMVMGLYSEEGMEELNQYVDQKSILSNSEIDGPIPLSFEGMKQTEVKLIVPEGMREIASIDVDTPCYLKHGEYMSFRAKTRGVAKKFPGFLFSGYRNIAFYGDVLVSMEQWRYMFDEISKDILEDAPNQFIFENGPKYKEMQEYLDSIPAGSTFGVSKTAMLIKFQKDLDKLQREGLINGLRHYFNTDDTVILDVPGLLESMESSLFYIILFSIVVSLIAMILSFFLILVSFIANIKESSWEFGVLRAIGLNKNEITRVYIYEAVALVLGSGLIGTVIGIIIAVTITMQFLMFLEFPFTFLFPWDMFLTTFIMGLLVSVLGSYFALLEFRDKSISNIVKGLI